MYENFQVEMAMQLSLQENPEYQDIDMSYESLINLEDVKCTCTPEKVRALTKEIKFSSRRVRSRVGALLEEDAKVRRAVGGGAWTRAPVRPLQGCDPTCRCRSAPCARWSMRRTSPFWSCHAPTASTATASRNG